MDKVEQLEAREPHDVQRVAHAWKRISAFMLDYVLVILPFLGLLTVAGQMLPAMQMSPFSDNPWWNQGLVVLFLTLPIMCYFALCEASPIRGTLGKRLTKISVVDRSGDRISIRQAFLRVAVKFLPWEYFHSLLWHWEGWPTNPASPTTLQIVALTVGWLAQAWYAVSLFFGSRRTPYDKVSGTVVVSQQWGIGRSQSSRA